MNAYKLLWKLNISLLWRFSPFVISFLLSTSIVLSSIITYNNITCTVIWTHKTVCMIITHKLEVVLDEVHHTACTKMLDVLCYYIVAWWKMPQWQSSMLHCCCMACTKISYCSETIGLLKRVLEMMKRLIILGWRFTMQCLSV